MFRNSKFQRLISGVLILTFTNLSLFPLCAAAQVHDHMEKAGLLTKVKDEGFVGNTKRYLDTLAGVKPGKKVSADERFSQLLAEIHEDLKAVSPQTALSAGARRALQGLAKAKASPKKADGSAPVMDVRAIGPNVQISVERDTELQALPGTDVAAHVKNLHRKHGEVKKLYAEVEQSFADTEQHLKAAKLPSEIFKRHQDALAQYNSRKIEFEHLMGKLEKATPDSQAAALAQLGTFMNNYPNAKPHQYTNPNKMPFGTPSNKVRAPLTTKEEFQANLFPRQFDTVKVASLSMNGIEIPELKLPALPNAADLAETDDVQITQAIKDQAVALNKNPVLIYNWVRNNIEFIPSYGSIQGSEMTLQNKRGNAFDTASLLIALYRASGIPARYVYGTIDVPSDKLMNWVGGVTKVEAAQSLLGQGGIPNVGLLTGGKINNVRMEHVWVEAYVDYVPSRGAVNKVPDTWVAMDASFKQYAFTKGMDLKNNLLVNSEDLLTQIRQGATINEAQGYVQNLNQANLQTHMSAYQAQVKTYIESKKTNATVGDVLGTQKIKLESHTILLGSLPYQTRAIGNTFQTLPDNLRWKFKTNIYAADGISDGSSPIIELNQNTAKLAGKKITLSFVPATQADQNLVNSYLPKPHADGTPIQPSELPTSLPGYLLKMKAEFRVDGQVVSQTAQNFAMGSAVRQANQYFNPGSGTWLGGDDNDITVGEYNAIGMDLQGIGAQQLKVHQARMAETKAKLAQLQQNPNDTTPINGLSKEDLAGDIVQTGILSYFAQADASDRLIAYTAGDVKSYRLPSYGRFLTVAQAHYFFGVVRNVTFPGVVMDVDYLRYHAVANDDSQATTTRFIRQAGAADSSAENVVPEAMFRDVTLAAGDPNQPQGVSAVKALTIAASQGQKIYTLNQSNQALHDTILLGVKIAQDVKLEIADALAAGREVTVHEKDITVNGWTGNGYIILDPDTGAGAYKIAGGANGGLMLFIMGAVIGLLISELLILTLAGGAPGVALLASMAPFLIPLLLLAGAMLSKASDDEKACFMGGLFLGIGAGIYSVSGPGGVALSAEINSVLFYIMGALGLAIPSTGDIRSCMKG